MSATFRFVLFLLLLYVLAVSCSQKEKEVSTVDSPIQHPLNPNGDSELALLMRAMLDEAELIQEQIEHEVPIAFSLNHKKILTAQATEPDKVASAEYHAYATAYLQAITNLQAASPDERLDLYDNMVSNCLICHQALCPGPMGRIKKLQY